MLITLALVKLTAASMMLWLPLRTDSAVVALDDRSRTDSDDDEDGGSKVPPTHSPADPRPRRPWPRRPRRGPHGSSPPGAPPRVRAGRRGRLRVQARRIRTKTS